MNLAGTEPPNSESPVDSEIRTDDQHALYLLACDHRRSFEGLLGIGGAPTDEDVRRMKDAKHLVWEGFERAVAGGAPTGRAGILIDTQYGERVARDARRVGIPFAIPIEKSGQREFQFEHGDRFEEFVEDFAPTYVKALVRYNPEGDAELNRRQRQRLEHLSRWLNGTPYGFLCELLVPPEPSQLEDADGDPTRYDTDLRPRLMRSAIEELQEAGIEPDLWKIEGLDSRDDCHAIAETVLRDGRPSGCLVLGRGASLDRVDQWILAARGVPGYVGFAIGRSIFAEAVTDFASGRLDSREIAQIEIARNFTRFVSLWADGRTKP